MSKYSHPKTIDLVWISLTIEIQHPTSVPKAIHLRKEGKLNKKQENWKQIYRGLLQSQFFFCLDLPACCQFSASHTRKHCSTVFPFTHTSNIRKPICQKQFRNGFCFLETIFFTTNVVCVCKWGNTQESNVFCNNVFLFEGAFMFNL